MKKLLFIPVLGFSLTTYPDFSLCYKKYKNYSIIPISKNYSISLTKQKNIIKYDPKLGIYLIKTKNKHYIHFKKSHLGVWIASISKNSIYSGNYAEYQTSLYNPAKISTKTKPASIVTDIFCNPIGIGVKGGFLSKSYIYKFIKTPLPDMNYLKFLGIIYNKNLVITKILDNSFAKRRYIPIGAKIIKVNNKKVFNNSDIQNALNNHKFVTITISQNGFSFRLTYKGN